jgi:hypothetical protein
MGGALGLFFFSLFLENIREKASLCYLYRDFVYL